MFYLSHGIRKFLTIENDYYSIETLIAICGNICNKTVKGSEENLS